LSHLLIDNPHFGCIRKLIKKNLDEDDVIQLSFIAEVLSKEQNSKFKKLKKFGGFQLAFFLAMNVFHLVTKIQRDSCKVFLWEKMCQRYQIFNLFFFFLKLPYLNNSFQQIVKTFQFKKK
jgi:hypothetical protein